MKNKLLILPLIFAFPLSGNASPERDWPLKQIEILSSSRPSPSSPVLIAVIDTGVDLSHSFLASMLWKNPGETGLDAAGKSKSTNGKDDDQNGFIDDVHGWNFVTETADVSDHHGHGTHVSGIIASVDSGSFPPAEPSGRVQLMILKYYDETASPAETLKNSTRALDYAIRNGAQIINYSGGGLRPHPEEREALRRAEAADVLVVAAAGNEGANTDLTGYFPANYELSNILSVGALNDNSQLIASSNFGERNVDLAAPGEDIPSSLPMKRFGLMTGTSQATAFASAVSALVLSYRPDLHAPRELIQHLISTGKIQSALRGRTKSSAVLNARRAQSMAYEEELAHRWRVKNYSPLTESIFQRSNSDFLTRPSFSLSWVDSLKEKISNLSSGSAAVP